MTAKEIVSRMVLRDVHVRQYLGQRRFELWADGHCQSTHRRPIDVESAVRKLLGVTNEEGLAVERELERAVGFS